MKNQIKEMKKTEENAAKKLEMLEKQSNYIRSRANSQLGKETDSLEGVWQVIKDLKEKMSMIQESVEEGANEKYKELSQSVFDKDNEYIKLLDESDSKLREVRSDFRRELKELKERHKSSYAELMTELDSLKLEKVEFLRKINELEVEKHTSSLNSQKAKIYSDQNENLKKELKTREENTKLEQEVLIDFMKQIEEKESMKNSFESKFKEIKKKFIDMQTKLQEAHNSVAGKKKLTDKEYHEFYTKVTDSTKLLLNVIDSDQRSTIHRK